MGVVYELFFTQLPQDGFTASDVVALDLHRGAYAAVLCDEDEEQESDRWWSHSPAGQEAWQIVSQWVWNVRLELGHRLEPTPVRTTEFAPAIPPVTETGAKPVPVQGDAPPSVAASWKTGRFSGQDFALQPDGTLRCPAHQALVAHEHRSEADGSLRVVYAASIRSCRPCPLRHQWQWEGSATKKPRQVSVLLHPLPVGPAPLLWRYSRRREQRRACRQFVRYQRIEVSMPPAAPPRKANMILSRAHRAHFRLSWAERLARNARAPTASQVTIKLFGVPEGFATSLGLARASYRLDSRWVPSSRTSWFLRVELHGLFF